MTNSYRLVFTSPTTGEHVEIEKEFSDTETVSAREWADDWAYTCADKHLYEMTEFNAARNKTGRKDGPYNKWEDL